MDRHFAAVAPDRLWVADFTYVPTWSGMVYVEAATLEWVHWFNIEQAHGSIDDLNRRRFGAAPMRVSALG